MSWIVLLSSRPPSYTDAQYPLCSKHYLGLLRIHRHDGCHVNPCRPKAPVGQLVGDWTLQYVSSRYKHPHILLIITLLHCAEYLGEEAASNDDTIRSATSWPRSTYLFRLYIVRNTLCTLYQGCRLSVWQVRSKPSSNKKTIAPATFLFSVTTNIRNRMMTRHILLKCMLLPRGGPPCEINKNTTRHPAVIWEPI